MSSIHLGAIAGTGDVPFVFSTPVWGASHLGLFLNVGLPSLLAPENLPALTPNSKSRFLIYILPVDEQQVQTAPSFEALSRLLPTEIIQIREEIVSPHRTMSDCHIDSLRRAEKAGAAAVFLPPDCIWSDGSMLRLEELARIGYSVIHISGVRVDRDGFLPELVGRFAKDGVELSLGARDLVAMGMRHLHPITRSHFFNEFDGGLMPANLMWRVDDEGILLRCFHLHPLLVKTQIPSVKFNSTIDDDLALRACPDASRDYVVADTDELLAFEISSSSHHVGTVCRKNSVSGVAAWAESATNQRHRELIRHCIRIHSAPVTESIWRAKEAESSEIVDAVEQLIRTSSWALLLNQPKVFMGRVLAVTLGRPEHSSILGIKVLVWLLITLRRIDNTFYHLLVKRNGSLSIAHPYWLVRRVLTDAVEQCIGPDDRHVIIIGPDPGLVGEIERLHPNSVVQSFAVDAKPSDKLVGRINLAAVDLLIAIDLKSFGLAAPGGQQIGGRRVLLRFAGDPRPSDPSFNQRIYVRSLGARFCFGLWNRADYVRLKWKPPDMFVNALLRLAVRTLSPVIYVSVAIIGLGLNLIGLTLHFFSRNETLTLDNRESRSLDLSK